MNITVYLASSMGSTPDYYEQVIASAHRLARHDHCLVCGGNKTGFTGVLADTALTQDAKVYSTMSDFMQKHEKAHQDLTYLQIVDGMDECKRPLVEKGDILVVSPGGLGMLGGTIQIISWARVGQLDRPYPFLGMDGYYDNLKE